MVYAVDFVIDVMNKISSTKPVMFQRDGSLFVASEQGFGQVSYGLQTRPQKRDKYGTEVPEILESKDLVIRVIRDQLGFGKKTVMSNMERLHVLPILYNSQDRSFTLENMIDAAKSLQKLPDDKKIRMVSGGVGHPTHAKDGISIWVSEARVMDKDRYLELVRMNEAKLLEDISSLEKFEQGNIHAHADISSAYNRLKFPNCAIITPYVLVSFPRRGRLSGTNSGTSEWSSSRTHFNERVIEYGGFEDAHCESPFNFYVTLNSHAFPAKTADVVSGEGDCIVHQIEKELKVIYAAMTHEPTFVHTINDIHNKAWIP